MLQNFMYTMLRDNNTTAAKISLDVMVELYRRNIWWVYVTIWSSLNTVFFFSQLISILIFIYFFLFLLQEWCQNS